MSKTLNKLVAAYPYQNEKGELLYEACRFEPRFDGSPGKEIRYRRPNDAGGNSWGLDNLDKVLYRLPELLDESKREHPVFVVEGEGKVEALRGLGFIATTSPCGAGHWRKDFGKVLRGRKVVILPDNDEPGHAHAMQVAGNLVFWHARSIRIVHLLGLPEGGDVVDWLKDFPADKTNADKRSALIAACRTAPEWTLTQSQQAKRAA